MGGKGGKGDNGGKGDKGGKGGKGGKCQRSLSQGDCNEQAGCTYYDGYGCYRAKNNAGNGKGGKGDNGGKGDKGGKGGKGGRCDTSLSDLDCAAQGCTYYDGYGCYGRKKTGGNG